jgi:hypothetical protein
MCFEAAIRQDGLKDADGSMEILKRALKLNLSAEQKVEVSARMALNRFSVKKYD